MLRMNVGQMTHVHTPKASRNSEAGLESLITGPLCAPAGRPPASGAPEVCGHVRGGRRPAATSRGSDIDQRGLDLLNPVWNILDLTPQGRGDWYPGLSYG